MKDRLRELQRYSQRMWGMEKSCVGDWLNRNEVLAALASQPSAEMVFTEQEQRLIDAGKRTKDSFFSRVAEPSGPSAHELMLAVTKVKVAGLWKFDQPKWYEAMAEALLHLRQEATPSDLQPVTDDNPDIREIAFDFVGDLGLPEHRSKEWLGPRTERLVKRIITVVNKYRCINPPSDLKAKLEALLERIDKNHGPCGCVDALKAIIEGKD